MSSRDQVGCENSKTRSSSRAFGILPRLRCVKRFSRNRNGAMAVEFAFLAVPFIGTLLAILETAMLFAADQMLETGVNTAARMIRTGQVQAQNLDAAGFKTLVCSNIPAMIACATGLQVDVRSFPSFGSIVLPPAIDANGVLQQANFTFLPGNPSDVVVVRVYYSWKLLLPGHISGLSNQTGNKRLLASAATFRNEPFESL